MSLTDNNQRSAGLRENSPITTVNELQTRLCLLIGDTAVCRRETSHSELHFKCLPDMNYYDEEFSNSNLACLGVIFYDFIFLAVPSSKEPAGRN